MNLSPLHIEGILFRRNGSWACDCDGRIVDVSESIIPFSTGSHHVIIHHVFAGENTHKDICSWDRIGIPCPWEGKPPLLLQGNGALSIAEDGAFYLSDVGSAPPSALDGHRVRILVIPQIPSSSGGIDTISMQETASSLRKALDGLSSLFSKL